MGWQPCGVPTLKNPAKGSGIEERTSGLETLQREPLDGVLLVKQVTEFLEDPFAQRGTGFEIIRLFQLFDEFAFVA